MIRTIIIDDEPRNIKLISGIIRTHCAALEVVGTASELSEVRSLVQRLDPELLLLDIEFPCGTIFSILEEMPVKKFQIIFITAFNTYASEAFKQHAIDYILKPVIKDELIQSVRQAEARIHAANVPDVGKLIEALKSGPCHARKIPLPSSDGILFVNEATISRCEANGRYTRIYLGTEKKLTVTRTLKEIESLLNPGLFFRVHHSHIVNLEMVEKYHRGNGGVIELTDGSFVDVSFSRKDKFLEALLNKRGC